MRTSLDVRTLWRQIGRGLPVSCACFMLSASLCSCVAVRTWDIRELQQPVTMNANPFACDAAVRPSMRGVGYFAARDAINVVVVLPLVNAASSTVPHAEKMRAEKLIGGNPSKTISGVTFKTFNGGCVLIFAGGYCEMTDAVGVVQQIGSPSIAKQESKQ